MPNEEELVFDDPAVLETVYDPLRYRLFRLLRQPRSVPELAAEVGLPANRLYYHVGRLVRSGLVRQVDARAAGKHTERVYGLAARRIRFSGDIELSAVPPGGLGRLLHGVTEELGAAVRAHEAGAFGEDPPGLFSWLIGRLTPEGARELEGRLQAVATEFADSQSRGRQPKGAAAYGLLTVLTPLPEPPGEAAPKAAARRRTRRRR